MKFSCLSFCLLALLLGAGAAAGQDMSLFQSMDMTGGAFNEDFVNGLFGIGTGASSVASGPWFGPEFENSSSAGSFFSEFYINTSIPVISGFTPVKFDVTHRMPSRIYFGSGQEVLYTQYQSAMAASRGNELWIQKGADWSQYAIVPVGTGMQFVAFTPAGGQADYYELLQTNSLNITGKRLNFYSGYNSLNFMADKVGRHVLFFVLNNQPSNSIIIDVIAQAPPAQQTAAAGWNAPLHKSACRLRCTECGYERLRPANRCIHFVPARRRIHSVPVCSLIDSDPGLRLNIHLPAPDISDGNRGRRYPRENTDDNDGL